MKAPFSLCLGLLQYVAAVARSTSRLGIGRLLRLCRFPANFLLKSFTWDALLVLVPGIMGLATGFRMRTDKNAPSYLTIVTYSMTSLPLHAPSVLLVGACAAIFLGVFRFSVIGLHTKTAVNYYMGAILLLTLSNLMFGIATVVAGNRIRTSLERNTLRQIRNLYEENSPLQLNSQLQEAWDVLQIQLSCCGTHAYSDYATAPSFKEKKEPLPQSCCTIRWYEEIPRINNPAQCQLDAKLGVKGSIYINMPGCLHPLRAWLKHYLHAQVFVMLIAALSQCIALVYSYVIYYRPITMYETRR